MRPNKPVRPSSVAKIGVLTESISRNGGGLFPAVRELSYAVNKSSGLDVELFALEDDATHLDAGLLHGLPAHAHPVLGPRFLGYAPSLLPNLLSASLDLLHVRGLWRYPSVAALRWQKRTNKPLIVSPAGTLEPWALQYKKWKKELAWYGYEKRHLRQSSVIHATSNQEADNIEALGMDRPIAVVPSGVNLPDERCLDKKLDRQTKTALFVSRIHPKKGLLNLVEAWKRIRPTNWRMIVAGPDELGHRQEVEEAIYKAGLGSEFKVIGPVYGDDKNKLFREAELFILPTFSENFGIAVTEALSWGVPVLTTRGTPWSELVSHRCGWWVASDVDSLSAALYGATSISFEERTRMGENGRRLVKQNYTWDRLGGQMVQVYQWLLGLGTCPEFVRG